MSNIDEVQQSQTNVNEPETKIIQRDVTEELLQAVRALFFGLPVTVGQKSLVKTTFSDETLRKVMKRRFLPELDPASPIGQVQDVWMGVEQMVFGQAPTTIEQAVLYKHEAIAMTRLALNLLENPDGPTVDLKFDPSQAAVTADPLQIRLLARNQFIKHVETQLNFLHVIAKMKKTEKPKGNKGVNADSSK